LDREDGIEHDTLDKSLMPHEIYEQKELVEQMEIDSSTVIVAAITNYEKTKKTFPTHYYLATKYGLVNCQQECR
jgi:hypothetical protein